MKKIILIVLSCFVATIACAETQPVQLSLIPDVALHAKTTHIKGFTLGIWSENPQTALALGIVNGSTGDSSGLSLAALANYSQDYTGAQLSFLANYSAGKASGLQWAAVNYAEKLHGLQLGFVNIAKTCDKGLQIGLVNVMSQTRQWFQNFPDEVAPAMVLVNWRL